ncbi:MAG: tripartite tricarboxylate transporter TctB family protein [Rhodospirillaceae bacterium]|nr:tripartite tricarboxylate transporter TctB family protein [Rhodospirillaceae bacterium]
MRRAELVTAVLMAAFSIYLMWKSAELEVGWVPDEGPGGGAWPFWLAAVMLACTVWIIINWFRKSTAPAQSTARYMDSYAMNMFLLVGGGLFVMIGLVHFIGMYGAIPIFLVYYLRILGRHSWTLTLSTSIGAPVVVFFFFDIAMRIDLPKGYLEPLFFPLYDIFL